MPALAVWLGLDGSDRFPGIVTAYAITDDFATAVINARLDSEKLPERLTLKGASAEAALARSAIRHIERTVLQHRLLPPTLDDLAICHDKVRRLYSAAYDWPAPPLPPAEADQFADTCGNISRAGSRSGICVAWAVAMWRSSRTASPATTSRTPPLRSRTPSTTRRRSLAIQIFRRRLRWSASPPSWREDQCVARRRVSGLC